MLNTEVDHKPPPEEVLVLVMVETVIHAIEALSLNSDGKKKVLWKTPSMSSIESSGSGTSLVNNKKVEG